MIHHNVESDQMSNALWWGERSSKIETTINDVYSRNPVFFRFTSSHPDEGQGRETNDVAFR